MAFDLALVKKHPYISGAIAIVGAIIAYVIFTNSSGSSGSTDLSGGTPDFRVQQLDAATSLQESQIAASVAVATRQSQVVDNQTAAALAASNVTTAAQLEAVRIQTEADVTKYATGAATSIELARETTQQQINAESASIQNSQIEANTTLGVASLQADTINRQTDAALAVAQDTLAYKAHAVDTVAAYINGPMGNKGGQAGAFSHELAGEILGFQNTEETVTAVKGGGGFLSGLGTFLGSVGHALLGGH